jgi:hypothetical protein
VEGDKAERRLEGAESENERVAGRGQVETKERSHLAAYFQCRTYDGKRQSPFNLLQTLLPYFMLQ